MIDLPDWFRKITFLNGLPTSGKTLKFYQIMNQDNGNDLVLNLDKVRRVEGIRYTLNFIKARNHPKVKIFSVPKFNDYARYYFLDSYKLHHPQIKHVLIDEVERIRLYDLILLCKNIRYFYPKVPIILAGVVLDAYNREFVTSKFLLDHCISNNINPKCKFCKNKSVYLLDVYNHHQITYTELDTLSPLKRKKVIKAMKRYPVCKKHYQNPPESALKH